MFAAMETGKQMNSLKVLNFKGGLTHFSQKGHSTILIPHQNNLRIFIHNI